MSPGEQRLKMTPEDIGRAEAGDVIHDEKVRGLHLRVFPARKSFYLKFRTKFGKERHPKIGDLGILTLTQAREIARNMLVEVAAGEDPVAMREQHRAAPKLD